MKNTGTFVSNFGHRISIEEVNCYTLIPFDIVCERNRYGEYSLTVVNNKTKVSLEVVDHLGPEDLHEERDKLIWKYLIELAK